MGRQLGSVRKGGSLAETLEELSAKTRRRVKGRMNWRAGEE